ncbi:hypothetical protein V8F33_005402 [Rhypophila sp. PSN 637]
MGSWESTGSKNKEGENARKKVPGNGKKSQSITIAVEGSSGVLPNDEKEIMKKSTTSPASLPSTCPRTSKYYPWQTGVRSIVFPDSGVVFWTASNPDTPFRRRGNYRDLWLSQWARKDTRLLPLPSSHCQSRGPKVFAKLRRNIRDKVWCRTSIPHREKTAWFVMAVPGEETTSAVFERLDTNQGPRDLKDFQPGESFDLLTTTIVNSCS